MNNHEQRRLTKVDYDRAFELWPTEISKRVHNSHVEPNWLRDGTERFWYLHSEEGGYRYLVVDPGDASSRPAFDHALLATSLSGQLARPIDALKLPISNLSFDTDKGRVYFTCYGKSFAFGLADGSLDQQEARVASPGLLSADGALEVFTKEHDLWVRDRSTSREWRLTADGEAHRAYGRMPDHDRMAIARSRGVVSLPPIGVFWSPDGRQILALRCDERSVRNYVFLESAPVSGAFRPIAHSVKMPFAGDQETQQLEYVMLAADGSGKIEITYSEECRGLRLEVADNAVLRWTSDGRHIYALASTCDRKRAGIVRIDRRSGECQVAFEERCDTFFDFNVFDYNRPNVEFLDDDRHAIWFSQKSGWGQLYLVDLEAGTVARRINEGEYPVFDVIRADFERNVVYFLAGGLDPAENPYHRHLCRCAIFGSAPNADYRQLTAPGFDHAIAARPLYLMGLFTGALGRDSLSPSGNYFVDNCSTVSTPTVTAIVRTTGEIVGSVCKAAAEQLTALGWEPPRSFNVSGEDGKGPVWGVLIHPRHRDSGEELPIVERIYAGPQMIAQPRSFHEAISGAFMYGAYALAEFGFAVVLMDAPGTPYRSKCWHDAPYGTADRLNVCQHARALKAISSRESGLSSSRIGINGHSWGGHAAAMGMLLADDTYKVGVSSAGLYDPAAFFSDASEKALGSPVYKDGTNIRGSDNEEPENYARMSPSTYARNLTGKLLLAYGELDENAPPAGALRFAASLIRARKTFDMLCLPGASHALFADPYFQTRLINFFVAHLRGEVPLEHYVPGVAAGTRMLI